MEVVASYCPRQPKQHMLLHDMSWPSAWSLLHCPLALRRRDDEFTAANLQAEGWRF
jgi:hypothetical protein